MNTQVFRGWKPSVVEIVNIVGILLRWFGQHYGL